VAEVRLRSAQVRLCLLEQNMEHREYYKGVFTRLQLTLVKLWRPPHAE